MARFSLHAVGNDRPGIVAGITREIAAMGWDIAESMMMLVAGQFAVVLVLEADGISDGRLVESALGPVAEELDLFVTVRPVGPAPAPFIADGSIAVEVTGANKPGIVAGIATVLAESAADIYSLHSQVVQGPNGPDTVMELVAALPRGIARTELETRLIGAATALGVMCTIKTGASPEA